MEADRLKSEWNQALAYHMRIDNALQLCNLYSSIEDFNNWHKQVRVLWRELRPQMVEAEKLEAEVMMRKMKNLFINKRVNVEKWLKEDRLTEAESFMREILRRRDMDLPRKPDPGRALLDDRGF